MTINATPLAEAERPFVRRTIIAVIAAGALCLGLGIYFSTRAPLEIAPRAQYRGSVASYSLIGHAAAYRLLQAMGVSVEVRRGIDARVPTYDLWILAEPTLEGELAPVYRLALQQAESRGNRVLLVLPKYDGAPHQRRATWIRNLQLKAPGEVQRLGREVVPGLQIYRDPAPVWTIGGFQHAPSLRNAQLMTSDRLTPLISTTTGGVLLGQFQRGQATYFVLSDPDLLNNQGLDEGNNPDVVAEMVRSIGPGFAGRIWFDETIHGLLDRAEHPLQFFFRLPSLIATAGAILGAVLLIWAASVRFGAPLPVPPVLRASRLELVDRTARMLSGRRHGLALVRQYLQRSFVQVANRSGLNPGQVNQRELATRLDALRAAKAGRHTAATLLAEVEALGAHSQYPPPDAVVALARAIHRWKEDMLHGFG